MCVNALINALKTLEQDENGNLLRPSENGIAGEDKRTRLYEKIGEIVGEQIWKLGRPSLVSAILNSQMTAA